MRGVTTGEPEDGLVHRRAIAQEVGAVEYLERETKGSSPYSTSDDDARRLSIASNKATSKRRPFARACRLRTSQAVDLDQLRALGIPRKENSLVGIRLSVFLARIDGCGNGGNIRATIASMLFPVLEQEEVEKI